METVFWLVAILIALARIIGFKEMAIVIGITVLYALAVRGF